MMNPLLVERLHTVVENLKGATTWRPRDVLNFATMLWSMPRPARPAAPPLHPAQVALTMFTRMSLSYEPTGPEPAMLSADSASQQALAHTNEPTVALFVDAPGHLSGVSLTLASWANEAAKAGLPFFLHTAGSEVRMPGARSFPKVGTLRLSSYPGLDVPIPDVRAVTDYMRGHPFDVAHLSTPGPMGLLGMRIAQSRGAPICGTYHTDFPRYVRDLTGSADLADFTWQFMVWFYGQMDLVAAPSASTRDDLIAHGLSPERVRVVGRGVELDTFSPAHRCEALRRAWRADGKTVLLYVGRLSREKNLPLLAEAYRRLLSTGSDAVLVLVGDGPARAQLEESLAGTPAVFTGVLKGADLSAAFASGDLFVFPSETDTFGRVVIEAQASGLPVVVSNVGGPRDAILPGRSGAIVDPLTADTLAAALRELCADPAALRAMGEAARTHALGFTPEASFNAFWSLHRHVAP